MTATASQPKNAELASKTIAVTGSTGLVGSALVKSLAGAGSKTKAIVRRAPASYEDEIQWDTEGGFVNPDLLEGLDAVVHLAAEPIAEGRWTDDKKHRILTSRVAGTTSLCTALAGLQQKPKVLACASAIGFYGSQGDTVLDESSAAGSGFLVDVCKGWEAATQVAAESGIRVVNIRIGIVLDKEGGALAAMLTPFKMCVGGKMGSGNQYWSWVSLTDLVGIIEHSILTESLSGPVNAVSPTPVTNIEFTKSMGRVLGRPTIFPMPGFAARLALGQMADDLLLASARVVPKKLEESGYEFQHSELDAALKHALK